MTSRKNHSAALRDKRMFLRAKLLLAIGLGCILVSLLVSLFFINGTGFKAEYRKRQYQECLSRNRDQGICNKFKP